MRVRPAAVLAALPFLPTGAPAAEDVRVTNLPSVQRVEVERFPEVQRVVLDGHAPATSLLALPGLSLAPVSGATPADDLDRLHPLGVLRFDGFRRVLPSAVGRVSGVRSEDETLEVVLLPATEAVRRAWRKDRVQLLPIRFELALERREKDLVQATAPAFDLRFPAYDAWVRNRAGRTVELDLYLWLTE
jgi:hypothetical protein